MPKKQSLEIETFLNIPPNTVKKGTSNEKKMPKGNEKRVKPKKKEVSCNTNIAEYFSEFSENTSIHGLRYVGARKRSYLERVIWLLVITISLCLCGRQIMKANEKWGNSLVIVNTVKPIWTVPFPAITLCPETKTVKERYNYTAMLMKYYFEKLTEEELTKWNYINVLCLEFDHLENKRDKTVDSEAIEFLTWVSPSFDEVLKACLWLSDKSYVCYQYMTPIITNAGYCFTFNMLSAEEIYTQETVRNIPVRNTTTFKSKNWTLENGYNANVGNDVYPRRSVLPGVEHSFSFMLTLDNIDFDNNCKIHTGGFKIALHSPADVPRIHQQFSISASVDDDVTVVIKPEMITTESKCKSYTPEARGCFFQDDRKLKYFKVYTQTNCEIECLANYTLKQCGCAAFHMPRESTTKICGRGNYMCMRKAKGVMDTMEGKWSEEHFQSDVTKDEQNNLKCHCLPACTSINYKTEVYKQNLNGEPAPESTRIRQSRVYFYFNEREFMVSKRIDQYDWTDFMADCGGLMGLFLGFSFISLAEIIYFLTLRVWSNIKMYGRNYWSGSEKVIDISVVDVQALS